MILKPQGYPEPGGCAGEAAPDRLRNCENMNPVSSEAGFLEGQDAKERKWTIDLSL